MPHYLVEIQIEIDAKDPEEARRKAFDRMKEGDYDAWSQEELEDGAEPLEPIEHGLRLVHSAELDPEKV